MKKIFQIVLVYGLGFLFIMSFVWRADCLNKSNNKLASNENKYVTYNK